MKLVVLALTSVLALGVAVGVEPAQASPVARGGHVTVPRPPVPVADELRALVGPRGDAKGTDSVAVIRAYWTSPDSTTQADVDSQFAKARAWFTEVSHGQFTITTASGPDWVRIAPSSTCLHVDTMMSRAIAAQKVATPGFRPGHFDHVVVYFPHESACAFAGLAERPGNHVWLNGVFPNGFKSLDRSVTTHEIGHNLGLAHSSSITCTTGGQPSTFGGTCQKLEEYGDLADDMGNSKVYFEPAPDYSNVPAYFNAAQMAHLGWLGSSLRTVSPCQPVTLDPYEGNGSTRAVHFPGSNGTTYWLEWRHPAAGTVDEGLPTTLKDGALLHETLPKIVRTVLVDARPDAAGDMSDAAIATGTSVTTPEGYTISVGAASSTLGLTISTARPTPPNRVRAHGIPGGALVSWSTPNCAGASPITGYLLEYRTRGGSTWHRAALAAASRRSFRIGGLALKHRYVVRVLPQNAQGSSVRAADSGVVRPLAPRALVRVKGAHLIRAGHRALQRVLLADARTHRVLAGARIALQARSGHRSWHRVAVTRTNRRGIAGIRTSPVITTRYRWYYAGNRTHSPTFTPVVRTGVAPVIGVQQTRRKAAVRAAVSIYGTLHPRLPGAPIALQRHVGKKWITVLVTKTHRQRLPNGTKAVAYRFTFRAPRPARLVLRVVSAPTRANALGISRIVTVRVR